MDLKKPPQFFVPYAKKGSIFGEEEFQVVRDLLQNEETLSCGLQRELFERDFSDYLGVKHAFSLVSCTVALELATYLLGLKEHDEVIATPFTYQATVQPLLCKNVSVKFCDIDQNSLCADVNSIKMLITSKTKAVYITHYGGHMVDMVPLMKLAEENDIIVIEDCAHSLGSTYNKKQSGSMAHISCFSFHSLKNMCTLGEGGMIAFNNDDWAKIIHNVRGNEPDALLKPRNVNFGPYSKQYYPFETHEKNAFTHECLGIFHSGTNANMGEIAAAVGRVQLKKLDGFNKKRNEIASYLNENLSKISELRIQKVPNHISHCYHLYTLFLVPDSGIDRNVFVEFLFKEGIEIILRYFPIHLFSEWRFKGGEYGQCPNTEHIWFNELINLPCYPTLTEIQLDYMISKILQGVEKCRTKKPSFF